MKKIVYTLIFCCLIFTTSCKKNKKDIKIEEPDTEVKDPEPVVPISFTLTGAKALIFEKNINNKIAGSAIGEYGDLLKMDENGNITSAAEGITIASFKKTPTGLYLTSSTGEKYFVKPDNSYTKIEASTNSSYKGYNTAGDIIFSNLSVFRVSTLSLEQISSSLSSPSVQSVSGDFAIIKDNAGSVTQILNTIDGLRYNVQGCNGPRFVAFNSTLAFIDDCSSQAIIDMTTGTRTSGDVNYFNSEAVTSLNGVVLLSQGLDATSDYKLGLVATDGTLSLLSNDSYVPGSSPCINCGNSNQVLYNTGDYFVIRETSAISVMKIGNSNKSSILSGYNIISISLKDNKVYFLAETTSGDPKSGIYDLDTNSYTLSSSTNYYDEIEAF